jgi:hypothetical protein
MTYPAFESHRMTGAEARTGPVTCASCGCRLTPASDGRQAWVHFAPMGGRDARGCRVECADSVHDASGRAAAG